MTTFSMVAFNDLKKKKKLFFNGEIVIVMIAHPYSISLMKFTFFPSL